MVQKRVEWTVVRSVLHLVATWAGSMVGSWAVPKADLKVALWAVRKAALSAARTAAYLAEQKVVRSEHHSAE